MRLPMILGTTLLFAFGNVSQAAVLEGVHGGVRVNQGKGYVAVRGATELKPGDMVMVDAKGAARLVYPDGCDVSVKARSVTIIGDKSPCSQMTAQFGPPGPPVTVVPVVDLWGPDVALWAVGGGALLVGGALAGGIAAASSGGNVSPAIIPLPVSP